MSANPCRRDSPTFAPPSRPSISQLIRLRQDVGAPVTTSATWLRWMVAMGRDLYKEAVVWDQHGCLPLRPEESAIDELALYAESGVDFISINVGMDSTPPRDALKVLTAF